DLAVLDALDRRIFHVAIPVDTHRAAGTVGRQGEGGIAEEARLAAGLERLSGLPMLGLALDDGGLDRAQRIGAALRGDRLIDELAGALRQRLAGAEQQRRYGESIFHMSSSLGGRDLHV